MGRSHGSSWYRVIVAIVPGGVDSDTGSCYLYCRAGAGKRSAIVVAIGGSHGNSRIKAGGVDHGIFAGILVTSGGYHDHTLGKVSIINSILESLPIIGILVQGLLINTQAEINDFHAIVGCPVDAINDIAKITGALSVQNLNRPQVCPRCYANNSDIVVDGSGSAGYMGAVTIIVIPLGGVYPPVPGRPLANKVDTTGQISLQVLVVFVNSGVDNGDVYICSFARPFSCLSNSYLTSTARVKVHSTFSPPSHGRLYSIDMVVVPSLSALKVHIS